MCMGLDPQIGAACDVRMHIGARRAPALAVPLRHLVDAEALMSSALKSSRRRNCASCAACRKISWTGLPVRRFVDGERTALAVIFAVEIGIVFRALEVGQHVVEGPAGVAERGPVVVVAAVAADIDHGVDRRRAAEPLAARLIADAAVEAGLRHGVEGPVVDLAGDHQHQRERRGDDPIVVPARRRRAAPPRLPDPPTTAPPPRNRRSRAHHHEIECIRHACFPQFIVFVIASASEAIHASANKTGLLRRLAPRNDG